jgi:hypothetical protein
MERVEWCGKIQNLTINEKQSLMKQSGNINVNVLKWQISFGLMYGKMEFV